MIPSRQSRRKLKACFIILLVLLTPLTLLGLGVAYTLVGDIPRHNLELLRQQALFRKIIHPPGTQLIRMHSRVGLISGNGNHCQYFVGQMRSYTGRRAEIEAVYSVQTQVVEDLFLFSLTFPEPPGNDIRNH